MSDVFIIVAMLKKTISINQRHSQPIHPESLCIIAIFNKKKSP